MLGRFPDGDIDAEELMRELYLKIKLDHAEAEVERGEIVAHDELVKRSEQWFR